MKHLNRLRNNDLMTKDLETSSDVAFFKNPGKSQLSRLIRNGPSYSQNAFPYCKSLNNPK